MWLTGHQHWYMSACCPGLAAVFLVVLRVLQVARTSLQILKTPSYCSTIFPKYKHTIMSRVMVCVCVFLPDTEGVLGCRQLHSNTWS